MRVSFEDFERDEGTEDFILPDRRPAHPLCRGIRAVLV
jgi:hypothetical protein